MVEWKSYGLTGMGSPTGMWAWEALWVSRHGSLTGMWARTKSPTGMWARKFYAGIGNWLQRKLEYESLIRESPRPMGYRRVSLVSKNQADK